MKSGKRDILFRIYQNISQDALSVTHLSMRPLPQRQKIKSLNIYSIKTGLGLASVSHATDISGLGAIGRGCSKNLKSGGLEASISE